MGAVLRWIFSLISALLWLSFSPRANSYHEALPFHAHRLYKRWEGSSTDGGGWNCRECGSNDSTLSNFSTVSESAQNRTGPLLVHLGSENGDEVMYSNGRGEDFVATKCVNAPLYRNFKILSHLSVEVALHYIRGTLSNANETNTLRSNLEELNKTLYNANMWGDKTELVRQTLDQVYKILDESDVNSNETFMTQISNISNALSEIAELAVSDYLENLHETILSLGIELSKTTTIVIYHKFAYPESFIVQYYNLVSSFNSRIILWPFLHVKGENCFLNASCLALKNAAMSANRAVSVDIEVSEIFLKNSKRNTSIHSYYLDSGAVQIICSKFTNISAEFCPGDEPLLRGFRTPTEKAYVVLFVFFGALSVVLGIFLLTICYEDRVIKGERSRPLASNSKTFERDRIMSDLSVKSNEE